MHSGADTLAGRAWPPPPTADDDVTGRLGWYAAVARWAPSKHNTQPWRFVVRRGALDVWADPMRMLPATDPHRRELVVSCGAAVELVTTAARAVGRSPSVTVLPRGDGPLLATVVEAGRWTTSEQDVGQRPGRPGHPGAARGSRRPPARAARGRRPRPRRVAAGAGEEPAVRVELRDSLRLPGVPQLVLRLGVGSGTPPPGRRSASDVTFSEDAADPHDGS